ncbi:hypothetical protein Vafri_18020, partial [Volvox africanus]
MASRHEASAMRHLAPSLGLPNTRSTRLQRLPQGCRAASDQYHSEAVYRPAHVRAEGPAAAARAPGRSPARPAASQLPYHPSHPTSTTSTDSPTIVNLKHRWHQRLHPSPSQSRPAAVS